MKTRFYLQENRSRLIASNTRYFYIGILVALWYKKVLKREKKLVLTFYSKITIIQKLFIMLLMSSEELRFKSFNNFTNNNNNNNNNGFNNNSHFLKRRNTGLIGFNV